MHKFTADSIIRMMPCRVWRCYTGGAMLDAFVGNADPQDTHLPEDWLASTVQALNGPNTQSATEGLARTQLDDGTPGPFLYELIASAPETYLGREGAPALDVLCKYLDSAVRLPIQCHPDRAFAHEHYHSEHGKTECWIILGTREINGETPHLLMGFRPGIRPEDFAAAVEAQDIPALVGMLHSIPARAGDAYIIPGRFPHAIGPGVFMLEVQEPSDWVVQPEAYCAGFALSPNDMWGPITPTVALDCFDYTGETEEQVLARTLLQPNCSLATDGGRVETIVGPMATDCFSVELLTVATTLTIPCATPYHIEIVTAGAGTLCYGEQSVAVKRGEVFFIPHGVAEIHYTATKAPLIIYRCSGAAITMPCP